MRNLADACCSLSPLFKEKNAMTKTAGFPREAVSPLLYWYDSEARDLPWRREPTPYRIWISEIMLQQTRVSAVIPYYLRFLGRFPDPFALSCADCVMVSINVGSSILRYSCRYCSKVFP